VVDSAFPCTVSLLLVPDGVRIGTVTVAFVVSSNPEVDLVSEITGLTGLNIISRDPERNRFVSTSILGINSEKCPRFFVIEPAIGVSQGGLVAIFKDFVIKGAIC